MKKYLLLILIIILAILLLIPAFLFADNPYPNRGSEITAIELLYNEDPQNVVMKECRMLKTLSADEMDAFVERIMALNTVVFNPPRAFPGRYIVRVTYANEITELWCSGMIASPSSSHRDGDPIASKHAFQSEKDFLDIYFNSLGISISEIPYMEAIEPRQNYSNEFADVLRDYIPPIRTIESKEDAIVSGYTVLQYLTEKDRAFKSYRINSVTYFVKSNSWEAVFTNGIAPELLPFVISISGQDGKIVGSVFAEH